MDIKIDYLSNNPQFIETVAKWIYDEFIDGIRAGLTIETILKTIGDCNENKFPIRLVAISEGKCIGTVSIVKNDLKCRDYTPWLASLYVESSFRNMGIGEKLIKAVKDIVVNLGYKEIYLRTEHASDFYRKLNWQFVESCIDEYGLEPDVFKMSLK